MEGGVCEEKIGRKYLDGLELWLVVHFEVI
jgi:hypothetical protein